MHPVLAHVRLFRPLNLFIGAMAVIISAILAKAFILNVNLILAILVVVFYNGAANAINDYFDYEIDRINRPDRPLPMGWISKKMVIWYTVIFFSIGSILALWLPSTARIIAILIAMPLMLAYSWKLKGMPLIGNGAVAFILGLTFIFSGAALNNMTPLIIPAMLAFGLTFIREFVKDMADVEGDRAGGLNTFPIIAGEKKSVRLFILMAVFVGLGSMIPFFMTIYGLPYLVLLIIGVELPIIFLIYRFIREPGLETAKLGQKILKGSTFAGLAAIYFG